MFYNFHYKPDNWRASQVRNMVVIEGNRPCSDNDWESITQGGNEKIEKWIAEQLDGKSCAVVLIGTNTAGRRAARSTAFSFAKHNSIGLKSGL